MTSDPRVTPGLIHDILDALERHGYYRSDDLHADRAIGLIGDLAGIYEGTQDHPAATSRSQCRRRPTADPAATTPSPSPGPTPSPCSPRSDIAADDKRYRVEMCPDCPDQSCPTCQTHIRDAQAFDQMADRMLQAAQAVPAASASQPAPDRWPQPAADREAGQ